MILYYALTTYHIQCCVLHKLTQKVDEKAVLLLSDIHKNSVAFLERYKNSGIFDDVMLLEESKVNDNVRKNTAKHRSKGSILRTACKEIHSVLPVKPEQMAEVYLCPDHFPFGWYIIKNKIKYHCFEEGCGVLSDNAFMLSNMSRNKAQYELMNVLGYFGNNPSAVEILADTQCQVEGYTNEKMRDFSVKRILASLDEKQLAKVLSFFGVNQKIDSSDSGLSLILTQHMANLGIMSLKEQHLLYCLLADYFLENTKIAVKPHPDDIAGRYNEILGNSTTVLPFAMPSELLPYCIPCKMKTVIAANSTAVKSMTDICERTICFDNRILTDFLHMHRYFTAINIIDYLFSDKVNVTTNADELMLKELEENADTGTTFSYEDLPFTNSGVTVISDLIADNTAYENVFEFLEKADKSKVVIFLNESSRYAFFDGVHTEVFKNIRPVFINPKSEKECESQEVYVFSKDKTVLERVEKIKMEKELKYTGVTIDIHSISESESEKIKLLEGVLNATEARLKEYINNKKVLDSKIEELEKGAKR